MLSNCTLKNSLKDLGLSLYIFKGDSMLPTLVEYKYAILDADELWCSHENVLSFIESRSRDYKATDVFIIHTSFAKEFVARLSGYNSDTDTIIFSFQNPDKLMYPDVEIQTYEILTMHLVTSVQRNTSASGVQEGGRECV